MRAQPTTLPYTALSLPALLFAVAVMTGQVPICWWWLKLKKKKESRGLLLIVLGHDGSHAYLERKRYGAGEKKSNKVGVIK